MAQIQPPTNNYVSQGLHGAYNAVDYAARTSRAIPTMNSREIYAVETGKITSYATHPTMGNRLELTSSDGRRRWGHGHLAEARVRVGDTVNRGQLIGIMGSTGYTIPSGYWGTHLHLVCYTGGKYVYPPSLMNVPFSVWTPTKTALINPNGPYIVRETPAGKIRTDGKVLSGQRYQVFSLQNGWAEIDFKGKRGFIGPIVYKLV